MMPTPDNSLSNILVSLVFILPAIYWIVGGAVAGWKNRHLKRLRNEGGWTVAAIVGSAAVGAVASNNAAKKAAAATRDAAKMSQVDIDKIDEQTRRIALRNAAESAALEKAMTPEVPELRTAANREIIAGLNDKSSDSYRAMLEARLGKNLETPLLKEALAKARADLGLGGKLSVDVQNAVTRRGLATAGAVGPGLGLGRDIVARDLGLSSYNIENDRLATALKAGELEQGLATDNETSMLNNLQLLQQINSGKRNFALGAGQYGESIRQPIVGLDPSSIANMVAGNATNAGAALSNQANIYGAQGQGYLQAAGQMSGALLQYKAATANNKPAGTK